LTSVARFERRPEETFMTAAPVRSHGRSVRVPARTAVRALHLTLVGAVVGAVLAVPTAASALPAPTLTVAGTSTATVAAGTSIVIGDEFTWSLTIDLSSDSTSSTPSFGNTFNDAVLDFSVTASAGNVGTWDPAGVAWVIQPVHNHFVNANGNSLTVQIRPASTGPTPPAAPPLDGYTFLDLTVGLSWQDADLDAVWQAGTITLEDWLGTTAPPLEAAAATFQLRHYRHLMTFDEITFDSTLTGLGGGGDGDVRAAAPTVSCSPLPVSAAGTVTCTVSGADAGIDILWRAAYNPTFAEAGVRIGADGTGTFAFVVPAAALGNELTVELVEWAAPVPLGVVGAPVPSSVPAGEGPRSWWGAGSSGGFAGMLVVAALLLAGTAGRVPDRVRTVRSRGPVG
jgi:hypothetical protein